MQILKLFFFVKNSHEVAINKGIEGSNSQEEGQCLDLPNGLPIGLT